MSECTRLRRPIMPLPLLAMLSASLVVSTPTQAEVRDFGGWIAGCDNMRICTALRTIEAVDGDGGLLLIEIRHFPHRDATPEIRIVDPSRPALLDQLRSASASITIQFRGESDGRVIRSTYLAAPEIERIFRPLGARSYRMKHTEARSVLYGLRRGVAVTISVNGEQRTLAGTRLDDALAHFDREQQLAGTPGALVLRPQNVMYDYAHPTPPDAETVVLSAFTAAQFDTWLAAYLKSHPGEKIKHAADLGRGLVTTVRYHSFDHDCGTIDRWGHVGNRARFALVERREMPICTGINEAHWIRTYHAETSGPRRP